MGYANSAANMRPCQVNDAPRPMDGCALEKLSARKDVPNTFTGSVGALASTHKAALNV